ncbi:MAG: DUF2341 domain-containing protein, partial [Euryarchaeota archaeon]|nr:DUF2341 domain-containing protein [Euryarchaeota archaeon]
WTLKSLTESSGNIDATTGTIIINGETNGGRAVDLDGTYTNNSGTLQIETTEDTTIDIAPASGSLWNLIIDTVGYDVTSGDANSDIDNNLTIINSMLLVSNTHTAHNITIDTNGEFNITSGTTLTTDGTLTLNGHFNITSGTAIGLNLSTTVFDLTHGINIALHTTPNPPADPNGWTNIDKYVNLTSIGASSTVDLNVTYTDADLSGPAEDTLVMYKYNETTATWTQTPGSGVDSTTNHVWADGINSFSDYIPLFSDIPVVVTNASTGVEETNATLQGYLRYDGNESTCTVRFEYGTTTAYGTNTTNQTKSEGQTFSADITSLTKGQLYHYRAYANNTVGSDTGDDSTLLTKPDPPSSLTATAYDNNNVNLTWVNGTGKNTTYIERNTTSSWARGNGTAVYNGTATSYQDTGLTAGMQYYYQAWSFTTWTYDTTTLHQWSDTNASATTNTSAYNKEILNMSRSTYSLEINISGTQLSGYISNTMVNTSIDTDWHYVSLTYDGTTMKLYKDGELKNSTTAGSISYPTQIPSLIAGRSLSGWLDELRISSTSRSASWINTTYQNTNNPETFATFGSETGVLSTWGCRKKITIDHLMTNATLTNFPVLIYNASDTDLKNSAQPTGDDIIFMSTSVDWTTGTWRSKLDHEIEKYDSSTGELVAWVRIPTFSSTTDTEIYMYYNNTLCTTNRENAEGVWDSNYEMVQHLHDEDEIADSTSNGNDGENNGVEFSRLGKIDGAISFHEGASINVETLNDGANYARGDYTLSLWFKTDANSEDLMSDYEDYSGGMGEPYVNGWVLGINKDDFLTYTAYDLASEASIVGDTKVVTIEWVYVVVVDRGETSKTGETTTIYLNGQVEVDGSRGAIGSGGRIFTLGAEHYTDILGQGYRNFFVGLMDEVRISDIARNSSWINASFNNMNSTSYTRSMMRGGDESDESDIFIRFGRQEIQNVAPAQSNPDPKNDATGVDLNPTLTITVDDLNLDVLDVMFYTNSSGSWTPIGSNTSVFDGTYHQTPNSFTSHSTKYYWSVNVTDGLSWTNATYALTTREVIISWCYQETADQDTACGGENNGNYTYSSNWSLLYPGTNGTDGNWSTYSLPDAENIGYVYVNYTKPSGATNASMWLTKSGEDPAQNCTIPQVCWDQDPLSIWCKIEASYPDDTVTWSCYDGASWIPLRQTMGPPKIYEEAIWWYSEI